MSARLILIHGRGSQPDAEALKSDWLRCLEHGLTRDHGKSLAQANVSLVYYGDICAELDANQHKFDPVLDRADRANALDALLSLRDKDFKRRDDRNVESETLHDRDSDI